MQNKRKIRTLGAAETVPAGNYISEWLGHRVFPSVRMDMDQFLGKKFGDCPFLTEALRNPTQCVKNNNSFGVCTVNTYNKDKSQDWLACPYRVISSGLVRAACERIFGIGAENLSQPIPVTLLSDLSEWNKFKAEVEKRGVGYVFFQAKLGGEISVTSTPKSPEISFDVTLVEIRFSEDGFKVGRYGIFEIQTMDFHGSYRAAVDNLRDALRLHGKGLPDSLSANKHWSAEGVEGPNIANVFKRTFYQILLKFQLSGKGAAAGTVLAIPNSVWESWQPFLGAPELVKIDESTYRIRPIDRKLNSSEVTNAYVCVFELDANSENAISPVIVKGFIQVDAEELAHYAFKTVPAGMLKSISESDSILVRIRERIASHWPGLV